MDERGVNGELLSALNAGFGGEVCHTLVGFKVLGPTVRILTVV
jgi:hypothetical protein